MSNPLLDWLDRWLNQRRDAVACLILSALALPIFSICLAMPSIARQRPEWYALYDATWTPLVQLALLLVVVALAVSFVCAWLLRRDYQNRTWLCVLAVGATFAGVALLGAFYGYKDSPLVLWILGLLVMCRALFRAPVYRTLFAIVAVLFVANEVALWSGWMPYAPGLAQPIFQGEALVPWWDFWLRILYVLVVLPIVILFFLIAWAMERERNALQSLARTDELTGLLNRREFRRRLEAESRRSRRKAEPLCLIILDLDHFKMINDRYGHEQGDRVLRKLGQILRDRLHGFTDVGGRWGGEEFVVLLPGSRLLQGRMIAESVRETLAGEVFRVGDEAYTVTLSAGAVEFRGLDWERALRHADSNLYQAKHEGRNRVVGSIIEQVSEEAEPLLRGLF